MKDIVATIARDVFDSVWKGVQDVFSTMPGALVALVVAILLSIFPTWILFSAALALFVGIIYNKYQDVLDKDTE